MGKSYPTKSELALIFMVKNDFITAEVLNAMWGRDYGSETLRDMARRGWAVEIDLLFKVGVKARAYKRTCFAITQKGIDYLDKCGYDLSVLVDDYNPIYKYAARKTAGPADAAARLLKEIMANIFFMEFDAVTLPITAAGRRTPQAASGNQADAAWDADIDDFAYSMRVYSGMFRFMINCYCTPRRTCRLRSLSLARLTFHNDFRTPHPSRAKQKIKETDRIYRLGRNIILVKCAP